MWEARGQCSVFREQSPEAGEQRPEVGGGGIPVVWRGCGDGCLRPFRAWGFRGRGIPGVNRRG